MRRRKKYGYILLTLLIVTGLAGTPTNNSLTVKERKFVIEHLKDTKTDLFNQIAGLSEEQLNFRSDSEKWSIADLILKNAKNESELWQLLEVTVKKPSNPDKRSVNAITDEQLINSLLDKDSKEETSNFFNPKNSSYKSLGDALTDFKTKRTDHIKYLRNSTEDLRNHVAQTSIGLLDCYQIALLISIKNNMLNQKINAIKSNSTFPK